MRVTKSIRVLGTYKTMDKNVVYLQIARLIIFGLESYVAPGSPIWLSTLLEDESTVEIFVCCGDDDMEGVQVPEAVTPGSDARLANTCKVAEQATTSDVSLPGRLAAAKEQVVLERMPRRKHV
ncbi:hypothetical protein DY000_02016031 [Brassica cretica]|uniref:Uncharacterized protein n=1 Tax=Brassica cretica TaxID=69181 RepID=A0ABQ7D6V8_BRACR|nr:hypothetical protein DY000_02016031 [Brassica cretica]